MNYLHQPNLLTQFWASVNHEFDKILDEFVRLDGWLFQDLGVIAKRANISDIFRCTAATVHGRGAGWCDRIDHFIRINMIILDAAKCQWLAPWRIYVEPCSKSIPPFLKRQIGGFFLLYMIYISQPLPNRFHRKQRIIMDPRDILSMHVFNATMQSIPKTDDQFKELGKQLVILFNDLVKSEAFEFSAFNDVFISPSTSIRKLLSSKYCEFTGTIYTLKDIRDQLHYITHQESTKVFRSLISYGRHLQKETQPSTSKPPPKKKKKQVSFPPVDKKWTVEEIKALKNENDVGKIAHCLPSILKSLDIGPVLTRERFTGHDEKTLDRELNYCVELFNTQLRHRVRSRKAQSKKRGKPEGQACDNTEEGAHNEIHSMRPLCNEYFAGKYDWVGKIFSKEELPATTKTNEDLGGFDLATVATSIAMLKECGGENTVDNDNDDWETDDDEDLSEIELEEEEESPIVAVDKDNFNSDSDAKEENTPVKKKIRVPLSMPSI